MTLVARGHIINRVHFLTAERRGHHGSSEIVYGAC